MKTFWQGVIFRSGGKKHANLRRSIRRLALSNRSNLRYSANEIAEANELSASNSLVIGQALVIPIVGQYYWVKRGDTLTSIAQQFGTSAQTLATVNSLGEDAELPVGLRLYIPPTTKRSAEVNAYVDLKGNTVPPALIQ